MTDPVVPETAAPSAVLPEGAVDLAPDTMPETAADSTVDPAAVPLPGEVPAHSPLAEGAPAPADPVAPTEPVAPAEPLLDSPAALPDGASPPPEPDVAEPATPEPATPEPVLPEPAVPAPGLDGDVPGVSTNRLPQIAAPAAPESAEADALTPAKAPDDRPLARFAAPFENPAKKPLYAILLLDDGKAQIDRAALAGLSIPLTIVLDPTHPEAGALADLYRKAGKEVAMLASAIPKGAKASDLQVSFEAHAKALPESVAVVDVAEGGFQNNRQLATDLVPLVKDQGRGLVTFDKGLNAGDQVARREGVPAALIFRELDAAGEAAPLIRRYLDRAAFKAVQDGRVVVLGHARPDMIAALLEWSVEGRAGSVALAPLTAVLQTAQ